MVHPSSIPHLATKDDKMNAYAQAPLLHTHSCYDTMLLYYTSLDRYVVLLALLSFVFYHKWFLDLVKFFLPSIETIV